MRRKLRPAPAVRATSAEHAEPQERSLKLQLAAEVNRILQQRGLTQTEAAEKLGIVQPHVSELAHYRLERFSAERLMQFLAHLGQEVEIRIHGGTSHTRRAAVRRIVVR
jgi:predicted XRE-type DNA-binding protein